MAFCQIIRSKNQVIVGSFFMFSMSLETSSHLALPGLQGNKV